MHEWDFPRIRAWLAYCDVNPPIRAMVQAGLGIEAKRPPRVTEENFVGFLQSISSMP
jgi:hypothetical protein